MRIQVTIIVDPQYEAVLADLQKLFPELAPSLTPNGMLKLLLQDALGKRGKVEWVDILSLEKKP